jgi:hypothetical protein
MAEARGDDDSHLSRLQRNAASGRDSMHTCTHAHTWPRCDCDGIRGPAASGHGEGRCSALLGVHDLGIRPWPGELLGPTVVHAAELLPCPQCEGRHGAYGGDG